jgi:hypothetical protein
MRRNHNGFGEGEVVSQQRVDFGPVQSELGVSEDADQFLHGRPGNKNGNFITTPMFSQPA